MSMSSYRKRAQSKPTTAAGLRAQASANGSSIFGNRPRSVAGLFSNQSALSNFLAISPVNSSTPSVLSKSSGNSYFKNPYTNSINNLNYQPSYSTYGGTASGYGGLTIPSSSSISSLNLALTPSSYNYSNSSSSSPSVNSRVVKKDSFNRPLIKSSDFGSKSSSLQSLAGSEGYVSGNERSGRSSRRGSIISIQSEAPASLSRSKTTNSENGEIDYKKLWEESQVENARLKEKLRRSDELLKDAKGALEKVQSAQNKSTLSEVEKRERRAMERKLSEMEEELKQLQKLKAENERLKAENRALTRVVSKLTNTTK